jgi:adenylate cyclase
MAVRSPEIEALVRRLFTARASGDDRDAILNLFSESEHFLAFGSEEGDWWLGAEGVEVVTDTWTSKPDESDTVVRIEAFENGPTGWAAVEGRRTRHGLRSYSYQTSLVLQLEGGAWKVIYVTFAIMVDTEEINQVDLTPGLSILLESLEGSAIEGDGARHTGTVMFTDIVDSTALSQAMGDQRWMATTKGHMGILRRIVEDVGGMEVKRLGDGAMFLFPSAASALDAAIGIQQAIAAAPEGVIRIRVGIHTGDLMDSERDLFGLAVHKAARVASAAEADQVLVSATTAGMVNRREYALGPPVNLELKGLEGTHVVFPLDWRSEPGERLLS